MKIAFFDSGIGGLTVLEEAITRFPGIEYLYYADTKNIPYGIKEKDTVIRYVIQATDFLEKKNIDVLVVACNTATSVAITEIRMKYDFPVVGMEPAIKPAIQNNHGKKVLTIATSLTLNESKLNTLISSIDKYEKIIKIEMDQLVNYAESNDFTSVSVKKYIEEKLEKINLNEFETIVLGCTHFIFYRKLIKEIVGNSIKIIDGNNGTINQLEKIANLSNYKTSIKQSKQKISFYSSGVLDKKERTDELLKIIENLRRSRI
ncbi:MAG: glutamate racemase [Spirochaetales bacterium]|nr:glutamate racemase [Spirochaetales bacterium]